jgi:hypothetical protein
MNGKGHILNYSIVPDEKHERLKDLLKRTWEYQKKPNTKCVYTDNTHKDSNMIEDCWKSKYPEENPIAVLQVLYLFAS